MNSEKIVLKILLEEKLKEYFAINNSDINIVVNSFSDLILKYVDCNYENLIDSIDMFIYGRKKGLSNDILSGRTSFDVSIDESKLNAKTFFHKGYPAIYFYRNGDQKNPFFKIHEEIKDGNHIYRARYKSSENPEVKDFEKNVEEFSFLDNKLVFTKTHKKKSFPVNKDNMADLRNLSESQYDFYELLSIILQNNNVKINETMSEDTKKIIFDELYKKMLEATSFSEELKVNEFLRLLVEVAYLNKSMSPVSEKILKMGKDPSVFVANNGMPLSVDVSECGETIMFDVHNFEGRFVAKYSFFKSLEGFTLVRDYYGDLPTRKNKLSTISINLTDKSLKVSAIGEGFSMNHPLEFNTKFNDDGSCEYSCKEKTITSTGFNPNYKSNYEKS